MRRSVMCVLAVLLWVSAAGAEDRERAFFDLYGGVTRVFESDVAGWKFSDVTPTVGARFGAWLGDTPLALTFRTWYFQSDAKPKRVSSPSDLHLVGWSVELLGRWKLSDRWALYGSLGPMLAYTNLDRQDPATGVDENAYTISGGVSGGVGAEVTLLKQLRGFMEFHTVLTYPHLKHTHAREIHPRIFTGSGLIGVRIPF